MPSSRKFKWSSLEDRTQTLVNWVSGGRCHCWREPICCMFVKTSSQIYRAVLEAALEGQRTFGAGMKQMSPTLSPRDTASRNLRLRLYNMTSTWTTVRAQAFFKQRGCRLFFSLFDSWSAPITILWTCIPTALLLHMLLPHSKTWIPSLPPGFSAGRKGGGKGGRPRLTGGTAQKHRGVKKIENVMATDYMDL